MKEIKNDILWRIYIVYAIAVLFAIAVIGRIIYIQVFEGEKWRTQAKELTTKYEKEEALRGNIYDINGNLIATSVPIFELRMDVASELITNEIFSKNIDSLALSLAKVLKDRTKEQYKKELINARRKGERYFLIKRNVSYSQLKKIEKFPIFRMGKNKGGLIRIQKYKREMPFQWLASRTIGFEREGIYVGLEGYYNKVLRGKDGMRIMQKISGGMWKPINDENEIEVENGMDIVTTIDINLQDVAENALMKQLMLNKAHHGCAVLMEVETGHVKAIANLTRKPDGSYEEMYNYAVGESSEPGSTFKTISMLIALEDNIVKPTDMVDTRGGKIAYANRVMKDSHEGGYGKITVKKAFELSSNVAISYIINNAYSRNPSDFTKRLYELGLNDTLGIDLPGEGFPIIKSPKHRTWSKVSLPWMSIGYELAMTPMQILTFYNAIANKGVMIKPMMVKEVTQAGKTITQYHTKVINPKICSDKTIKDLTEMLKGVVMHGTAINISTYNYSIAGKTGTAQIANRKHGYKSAGGVSHKASFAGFFPADNPKYSCIVVINNPTVGSIYGNAVAAPVFKEIADKVYATRLEYNTFNTDSIKREYVPNVKVGYFNDIYKIYESLQLPTLFQSNRSEWVATTIDNETIKFKEKTIVKNGLIPDVRGMGLRDAMFLLENLGLNVKFIGKGTVNKQSIEPGTKINKDNTILLELS